MKNGTTNQPTKTSVRHFTLSNDTSAEVMRSTRKPEMDTIKNKPSDLTQPASIKKEEPGWLTPQPEKIPRPTYWPIVVALGTIMGLAGIVTAWAVSVVGLALLALGLGGWIGEIRNE